MYVCGKILVIAKVKSDLKMGDVLGAWALFEEAKVKPEPSRK